MRFIFIWLVWAMNTFLYAQPQFYIYAGEDQTISLSDKVVNLAATVDPGLDINLDSKSRTLDGVKYEWKKVTDFKGGAITNPHQLKTSVRKLQVGTYEFEISAFYRDQLLGSDIVAVTVQDTLKFNLPPKANAGQDVTINLPRERYSIEGTWKDDGEIAALSWKPLSNLKVTVDQDGALLILSNFEAGQHQFEFQVIDDQKNVDRDVVNITVRPENKPPQVNAGKNVTISMEIPSTVLIGSATDDNDQSLEYQWRRVPGNAPSEIEKPNEPITLVKFPAAGSYTFSLTATDDQGASGSAHVVITVNRKIPLPPPPPVAKAGPNQEIRLPENSITLLGKGSGAAGTTLSYYWTKTAGSDTFEITDPTNPNTTVTGLTKGEYTFTLHVVDNFNSPDSDSMQVTVLPNDTLPNIPPVILLGPLFRITSAIDAGRFKPTIFDPDGTIASITWTIDASPAKVIIDSAFQLLPIDTFREGAYVFTLTAVDNREAETAVTFTITAAFPKEGGTGTRTNWPLIAAIVFGALGITAASKYYFGILPPPKKVLVYYLDKSEEAFVDSIMPNAEKTESYSVGRSNASDIKKLRKRNIAVLVLNTNNLVVNTPGRIQTYNYEKKKGFKRNVTQHSESVTGNEMVNLVGIGPQQQSETPVAKFPSFTIITLDGPLLPAYEKQLKEKGIEILQHVPINSYIIRVNDASQLNALKEPAFNFIRLSQPYSPEDTGLIVRDQHFRDALQANDALTLDLLLHREDDRSTVLQFLEKLPITILEWYRNRIRISAPANAILGLQLSQHTSIQAIYEFIPPDWTNDVARQLIGIDKNIAGECAITETGEGEIVGVADSGIDQKHVDLMYQVTEAVSWGRKKAKDTSDPIGHGTHVAASIAGNGAASGGKIKGMAPGAKLFFQSLINNKGQLTDFGLRLEELFQEAYDAGARIHNNSWGAPGESRYTVDTTVVDEFIYEHPDMLIVFAVGNNGCYDKKAAEKGYVGKGSISSPATMKNGLSVGASRNKRTTGGYADKSYGAVWKDRFPFPPTSTESVSGDPEGIAAFSARGQCDDFRMKPDIVAPGTDILSARSADAPHEKFHGPCADYNDAYAYLGGTSMSAPIVAGAAALVREYYKKQRNCQKPSAALIKATLINGARKLSSVSAMHGGDIPNANQGYGMLDMLNTIPNSEQQFQLHFHDSLTDPNAILKKGGEGFKTNVRLSSISWIRVCLAFTDFPARGIQSDLDLIIEYNATKEKWSGNRKINGEDSKELRVADRTNNLEIVRLTEAQPGSYTVHVIAHNLLNVTQGFALVITTGDMGAQFG